MVDRPCACDKHKRIKVPCSQESPASCGSFCSKRLVCGHMCPKMCHKHDDDDQCPTPCSQTCNGILPCGHKHTASACHYPALCQDVIAAGDASRRTCFETIKLHCRCGNLTREEPCSGQKSVRGGLLLHCDDSCDIYLRNLTLANALGINIVHHPVRNSLDPSASGPSYSGDLIDLYLSNPSWCRSIETQLTNMFVKRLKSIQFEPMRPFERMFVQMLAEQGYNFETTEVSTSTNQSSQYKSVRVTAFWESMGNSYPRRMGISLSQYVARENLAT